MRLKDIVDMQCYVVKQGSQYCVKSETGKNLGCKPSKGGAEKRLAQVEYFKHKSQMESAKGLEGHGLPHYGNLNQGGQKTTPPMKIKLPKLGPKKPISNGMPPIRANKNGEPMVGNMGPKKTETKAWFDPNAKRVNALGEPDIPSFSYGHMDVQQTFHPPSLRNPQRVPTDDLMEKDDRFLDVTKRKQRQKDRMNILKRSVPGGAPPLIPVRTTLVAPHMATVGPLTFAGLCNLNKPKPKVQRVIQRPAKVIGAKRSFVPYSRRGSY